MITFVSDVGLNLVHSLNGDTLGIGVTLANFHKRGTFCCLIELLKIFVIIGAKQSA